jgi:hypothetical protein
VEPMAHTVLQEILDLKELLVQLAQMAHLV